MMNEQISNNYKKNKKIDRDLSIAATGPTPAISQNVSSSKLRSKSSLSQYRKKDSVVIKDLIHFNI